VGYTYIGVVRTDAHRRVIRQTMAFNIVAEISLGKRDGFACRRKLSREQSLGGEAPEPKAVATASSPAGSAAGALQALLFTPDKNLGTTPASTPEKQEEGAQSATATPKKKLESDLAQASPQEPKAKKQKKDKKAKKKKKSSTSSSSTSDGDDNDSDMS